MQSCLTTGPWPHPMRSSTSSFNPLASLRSSSSCLRLLPRPPSLIPSIFPSTTCVRRQFLRKMWLIQSVVLHFIARRISLSSFIPSPRLLSCLRLLPRPPSLLPSIFPSITCVRRQFLRKMWPIQSAFLHCIACRTLLSSFIPWYISPLLTRSVHLIFSTLLRATFLNLPGISDLVS
jgi:hypothetical protein